MLKEEEGFGILWTVAVGVGGGRRLCSYCGSFETHSGAGLPIVVFLNAYCCRLHKYFLQYVKLMEEPE